MLFIDLLLRIELVLEIGTRIYFYGRIISLVTNKYSNLFHSGTINFCAEDSYHIVEYYFLCNSYESKMLVYQTTQHGYETRKQLLHYPVETKIGSGWTVLVPTPKKQWKHSDPKSFMKQAGINVDDNVLLVIRPRYMHKYPEFLIIVE